MRGNGLVLLIASVLIGAGWFAFADSPPETPEQVQKFLQKLKEADKEVKNRPILPPLDVEETKQATPAAAEAPKPEEPGKADEEILRKAGLKTDGPALLEFFRSRTLRDGERDQVARQIRQLGAESYRLREQATRALVKGGPKIQELLRSFQNDSDREVVRRVERCLQHIQETDASPEAYAAAVRLLALRKPAETVEVMLAYVPYTQNDLLQDEISALLTVLTKQGGKADPQLLAALGDREPTRRGIAGEALCRADFTAHQVVLQKMLADPQPLVRFRVAQAMAHARQREAIPVLINTLPELPLGTAWEAEDFLFRLAESSGRTAPMISLGTDAAGRQKCRDTWLAWWKSEGERIDLAKMQEKTSLQGYTLVVLLDQGNVLELGTNNQPRWQINGLVFPLDVQLVGDKTVLVAEYHGNRVTERDLRGNIVWEQGVAGPLVAQRLPNGNTFVATDTQFLEYDKDGNEKLNLTVPDEQKRTMKAMKLPSGEIACLTSDARVVRYDVSGKELKEVNAFTVQLSQRLFGGRIHMLPNGRVLVPHNAEDKVVEYDARGKPVWEVQADKPVAAVRLSNGHTLITSMNPATGAVEVDRGGREVWSYRRTESRVTRALKR